MSNKRVVCELLWRGVVSHTLSPSPFMRGERERGEMRGERGERGEERKKEELMGEGGRGGRGCGGLEEDVVEGGGGGGRYRCFGEGFN